MNRVNIIGGSYHGKIVEFDTRIPVMRLNVPPDHNIYADLQYSVSPYDTYTEEEYLRTRVFSDNYLISIFYRHSDLTEKEALELWKNI